jgi:hypothetical protein
MTTAALGSLVVEMSANLARFEQDMSRATQVTNSAMGRIESLASGAATALGAIGGGLSLAVVVDGIRKVVAEADKIGDMAEAFGLTAEQVGEIGYAAKVAGTDMEELERALTQISLKASAAAGGDKGAIALFEALGQSVDDLKRKDFNTLTRDVLQVFTEFEGGANKVALAKEVFGRGGVAIIEVADKLQKLQGEAQRAGQVLGGDLAKNAGDVQDAMNRLSINTDLAKTALVANLLPGLERVTAEMIRAQQEGEGLIGVLIAATRATFFGDELLIAQKRLAESTDKYLSTQRLIEDRLRLSKGVRTGAIELLEAEAKKYKAAADEAAAYIKLQEEGLNPKKRETKREAPPAPAAEEKPKAIKAVREDLRSVEDYVFRVSEMVARAIGDSAVVKTRELQDAIAQLDKMFFDGQIPVDIYESAIQKLTGTLSKAKGPANEIADLLKRTPSALQDEANRLTSAIDEAFFNGDISAKQQDELLALVNGYRSVEKAVKGVDDANRTLTINLNSALESLIFDTNKSVSALGVLSAMLEDVGRSIFQSQVTKPISDATSKGFSFVGKGISDFISGLFANAEGGLYKVGGVGGVDSQVVAMRATPGETVAVFPPGRGMGGGGGNVINIDNRGADRAAVEELKQFVARLNLTFNERAVGAVLSARGRGVEFT